MKQLKTYACALGIATSLVFVSCSTNRELSSASSNTRHSRFLNDISLGGNSTQVNMTVGGENVKKSQQPTLPRYLANFIQQKYSAILGVVPQALNNLPLYNFIEEWYGTPYRWGGNDKSGIDCSAFVQRLYENVFGVNLVRTALEQFGTCKMLWKTDSLKEGDLVFFASNVRGRHHHTSKRISHVGIYLANNYFVHASSSNGVMISSLKEDYWQAKFAGAGEVPKSM